MAVKKFLTIQSGKYKQAKTVQSYTGAADAEKLVNLTATGHIDGGLYDVPPDTSFDTLTVQLVADEGIGVKELVNIFFHAGSSTMKIRKATNTDPDKYAMGSNSTPAAIAGTLCNIQVGGVVNKPPGTGYPDVGYLGLNGQFNEIAPTASGSIIQKVILGVDRPDVKTKLYFDESVTIA